MKINRHSTKEENKTTAFWLYEFAHDLEKNAQNVDYLKQYLNKVHKNKKFNSIEEKLADIRERIGFDLTQKVVNELEKTSHDKTAGHDCACNSTSESCSCPVKTAMSHAPRDVELMGNILTYIKDMVQHEPHLDSATILSRCKHEDGLRFSDLEKKIDRSKLVSYVNDLLGKGDLDESLTKYVPSDSGEDLTSDSDDAIAEYYNHAEPSLS
jgi:hypothetical protein